MKPVSKSAALVLNALTAGLKPGESRKVDTTNGVYMAVSVEHLYDNHFAVAHYYRQNGDMVPDPDMEFYRTETGEWLPVNCTMATGYFTQAIRFGADGKPEGFYPRALRELASFASMWMKNIKSQQDLKQIQKV